MLALALVRLHRLALLVTLAVALTATGFAHRLSGAQDEALAFVLATGSSFADFCGDGLDGGARPDPHCLACQIVGSADLPPAGAWPTDLEFAFQARVVAPRESRALPRILDPANAPQGPPAA
jgi:hypothetical protein